MKSSLRNSAHDSETPAILEAHTFIGSTTRRMETTSFVFSRMTGTIPAREVPRHSHETAYFFFVLRGLYATEARGANGVCAPSSVIFNPSGTTHRDHFLDTGGEFLTVGISRASEDQINCEIAVSTVLRESGLVGIMHAACRELREPGPTADFALDAIGWDLVALCARDRLPVGRQAPSWLLRVRDRLRDESTKKITITAVASEAGVHPVYIARAFRQYFGHTPSDYIRACRIERARKLLGASSTPLCDVAQVAGFYDQSQFANSFKVATGLPPSKYRARFGRYSPKWTAPGC
jgi:AraC family transcriptional regulator